MKKHKHIYKTNIYFPKKKFCMFCDKFKENTEDKKPSEKCTKETEK